MAKNELNFGTNIDFSIDFNIDFNFDFETSFDTRYMKPVKAVELDENHLLYEKAEKLAKELNIQKNTRQFVLVSGAFIFGDFIEAFVVEKNLSIERMLISTLSVSQENVDSFLNLIKGDYVEKLDLIISDYFYAHERHALIPYIYKQLDKKNIFQLAVASCHTKICMIKTKDGQFIVIHGSANMRSSNCIEQFVIEENESLYKFNEEFHDSIIEKFKTINKSVRNKAIKEIFKQKN